MERTATDDPLHPDAGMLGPLNRTLTQVYGQDRTFRLWEWSRKHIPDCPETLDGLTAPLSDPQLRVQVQDLVRKTLLCLSPLPSEGQAPVPGFPAQRSGEQLVQRMENITEKILFIVVGKSSGQQIPPHDPLSLFSFRFFDVQTADRELLR